MEDCMLSKISLRFKKQECYKILNYICSGLNPSYFTCLLRKTL